MIVYISVLVKTVIQFLKLLCLDSPQENWILTELLPKQLQWFPEKEKTKVGGGKAGGQVAGAESHDPVS